MLTTPAPRSTTTVMKPQRRRLTWHLPHLSAGALLALGSAKVSASVLGSLATSVGVFPAFAALRALKVWPAGLTGAWGTSSGAALVLFGGAAFLWRARRRIVAVGPMRACQVAAPAALPPGFDRTELLDSARRHFVQMQAAWDAGDLAALRALALPAVLEDLCGQLAEEGQAPNRTDVVTLHAELLGFEDLGPAYVASIEFSGMIRESTHAGAVPFRELWMLAQSKDGPPAWRLARHQALL
jgi:hypothetical protein